MNIASIGIMNVPPATLADAEMALLGFRTALVAAMKPAMLAAPVPSSSAALTALPSPPGASAPARQGAAKEPAATALIPSAATPIQPSVAGLLAASGGDPLGVAARPTLGASTTTTLGHASPAADAASDETPVARELTEAAPVQLPDERKAVAALGEPVSAAPEVAAETVKLLTVVEADGARAGSPPIVEGEFHAVAQLAVSGESPLQSAPLAAPSASTEPATTASRPHPTAAPRLADAGRASAEAAQADGISIAKTDPSSGTAPPTMPERPAVQSAGRSPAIAELAASREAPRSEPGIARGDGLPSSLLSQSLTGPPRPTAASPFPPQDEAVITARPGAIGREMGVEIVRRLAAGKDELLIRLNPQEMGRVEVRLSFGEGGSLRAVVTADNPAALEMLRRDAGDLSRTLSDAGVRADPDSFRFSSRGNEAGQGWQGRHEGGEGRQGSARDRDPRSGQADLDQNEPAYRHIRLSGHIDLMA